MIQSVEQARLISTSGSPRLVGLVLLDGLHVRSAAAQDRPAEQEFLFAGLGVLAIPSALSAPEESVTLVHFSHDL